MLHALRIILSSGARPRRPALTAADMADADMAEMAIDLDVVSSAYGTKRVCNDISLKIRRGAKVILVGSNGAGKSSLLNLLAGKRRPTGGSATVLGADAFECTALTKQIALVTSDWMDCVPGTNIEVMTLLASAAVGVAPERVTELVEVLGAHELLLTHVNALSEGQRRCVHLLCKLLPPRDMLLLDEATSRSGLWLGLGLGMRR